LPTLHNQLIKIRNQTSVPKGESKAVNPRESAKSSRRAKTEKKTTQKPKTYTKDDYHGPIKTGVRPGVPAE
jgi:hypothetical protein